MDNDVVLMETDDNDLPEFTLAEILEMENLFKGIKQESITQEFCQELAHKFSSSTHRIGKSSIIWEQVQSWFQDKFQDKEKRIVAKVTPPPTLKEIIVSLKAVEMKKRVKVPTISVSEASSELSNLIYEARSAKDYAWFDVGHFINYRVMYSGDLEVRVRFAGFGNEEDEWVSVKRAIRARSIPLDDSECEKVGVGDLVLCYKESEDHALYCDAHVVEIERKSHDSNGCTCVFLVRYDYYNCEEKVPLSKICCRPTQSESKGIVDLDCLDLCTQVNQLEFSNEAYLLKNMG